MDYRRYEDENEYEYIYRLGTNKDMIGTWQDVADILNSELNYEYTESRYRKMYQAFSKMMEATQKHTANGYAEDLQRLKRDLEKERKKIQTEKVEYNKWLREQARDEMICEAICDAIRELDAMPIPVPVYGGTHGRNGIVCFGDEHFGTEFSISGLHGEVLNQYSPEIFYDRMNSLMGQILEICDRENLNEICVYALGDFVDGILRVSQLMKLRYGVVESTVKYADYICKWLNELTQHVRVSYQMARHGNHTELRMLGQPKGTFTTDNMDLVVAEMIKVRMENNPNFSFVENPTGYIFDNVCGFNILGLHGEVKSIGSAIKDFSHTYQTPIDILIAGHKHHSMSEAVGLCRDVIGVPSIMGTDDYAMKLNATSNAGATFLIIEEGKGKVVEYAMKLR